MCKSLANLFFSGSDVVDRQKSVSSWEMLSDPPSVDCWSSTDLLVKVETQLLSYFQVYLPVSHDKGREVDSFSLLCETGVYNKYIWNKTEKKEDKNLTHISE